MKTFSQARTDIYNQYAAFYEKNPALTLAVGGIATLAAAYSFIPTVAALLFVSAGHFFTDLFEVFAPSNPTPAGSVTPPLEGNEQSSTGSTDPSTTAQITQTLTSTLVSSKPASPEPTATSSNLNSGRSTPVANPKDTESNSQNSSYGSLHSSDPELATRKRNDSQDSQDSTMSNNM